MSPLACKCLIAAAITVVLGLMFQPKPARPAENTCVWIEQAIKMVGIDPEAIEQLAKRIGIEVTPARRRAAHICLRKIARK